jgi:hypothetical protein
MPSQHHLLEQNGPSGSVVVGRSLVSDATRHPRHRASHDLCPKPFAPPVRMPGARPCTGRLRNPPNPLNPLSPLSPLSR